MRTVVSLSLLLTLVLPASGEILELTDGRHVEGKLISATSQDAVFQTGGKTVKIPADKIRAVYFGPLAAEGARQARISKAQADVRALASAVSMYAAHMGTIPKSLAELTYRSQNSNGAVAGPFMSLPVPAPGWSSYSYRPNMSDGTFEILSSGDGAVARVP